jgi:hypothetical protein
MSEARDYQRLKCVPFGRELLLSQDLDPVYTAIYKAKLPSDQLGRLLVAYWCLYHLGCAARLSERKEDDFWACLALAAANREDSASRRLLPDSCAGRWPRGTERRHWRGQQSVLSFKSVLEKARCGRSYRPNAEHLVDYLASGKSSTFKAVTGRVQELRGFGPWIAFKVADMLERVAGYQVDFNDCALAFYDEPAKGAALFMREQRGPSAHEDIDSAGVIEWAVGKLRAAYKDAKAPPDLKRGVTVQECETVLCKWKSHLNGHYAPGKDTREVAHGLAGWGDTATNLRTGLVKLKYYPAQEVR